MALCHAPQVNGRRYKTGFSLVRKLRLLNWGAVPAGIVCGPLTGYGKQNCVNVGWRRLNLDGGFYI